MENVKENVCKKRMEWLDIAKGIAILLVIAGHVSLLPWQPYRKVIFSIHMPLFFVAAGVTTKGNVEKEYIKRLTKRLLVPYFLVAMLTILCIAWRAGNIDIVWEIKKILWASGVPANYGPGIPITGTGVIPVVGAIWFLPCIWWSKIFFGVILKYTEDKNKYSKAILVFIVSLTGFLVGQKLKVPFGIDIAAYVMVFMYGGYLIKKYDLLERKCQTLGIISMILWWLAIKCGALELSARYYRKFPDCILVILGAIAGTYVVFVISHELIGKIKIVKDILIFCGKHSMLMLCIHHVEGCLIRWEVLFSNVLRTKDSLYQGFMIAIVRMVFVMILCYIITIVKNKKGAKLKRISIIR